MRVTKDGPFPMFLSAGEAVSSSPIALYYEIVPFVTVLKSEVLTAKKLEGVARSKGELERRLGVQFAGIIQGIDWEKDEVVIVCAGEKPTNGYYIEIFQIMRFTDRGGSLPTLTEVSYRESQTGGHSDVLTYPLHVIKCERADGETRFNGNPDNNSLRSMAVSSKQLKCENWKAWHDWMPVSKPKLHVEGHCSAPTTGYKVELVPASPQGINPLIYILEVRVTPPTGEAGQMITDVTPKYEEETSVKYTNVTIRNGSEETTVKVRDVH